MANEAVTKVFPGYERKKTCTVAGLTFVILEHEHECTRHESFGYGDGGCDVSHRFDTRLLLLPRDEPTAGFSYLIFRINGYSTMSDRYDQDSVSLSCQYSDGRHSELRSTSYYQKYGGKSSDSWGDLEELGLFLTQDLGYGSLTPEGLRGLLTVLVQKFRY